MLFTLAMAVSAAFARSRQQFEDASANAERMRAILDASPVPMALNDPGGRITFLNRSFTETFGYALQDIPTLDSWWNCAYPDPAYRNWVIKTWENELKHATQTGTHFNPMEIKLQCKDGSEKIAIASAARYSVEKEADLLAVLFDITERKRAQDKLQLAAGVFTHALEGIMITTPGGTIIDVNDSFTRITGYGREEAAGQNPSFLSSGRHDPDFYASLWGALTEYGRWTGEIWNRRKNGEVFAELLTISAVRDTKGITQQYVALFSDITAREVLRNAR